MNDLFRENILDHHRHPRCHGTIENPDVTFEDANPLCGDRLTVQLKMSGETIEDIRFESFCEHHLLPFTGVAHVAYLPNGNVIGLSKIPRVIDVLAKRPQMQERLTEDLADLLMRELDAKGVAVVMEASHSCMTIRGVHKAQSSFVTSAMRGAFKERLATRSEVMSLIFGSKSRD